MWRTLIVSPAVLGATLLISTGSVRAAASANVLSNEGQTATAVGEPGTAEAQNPEVQSKAIATLAAPTAPEAEHKPEFATVTTPTLTEPKLAEIKLPNQLAVAPNPETAAPGATQDLAPAVVPPVVNNKVAQATPSSNDADVLNQINRYSKEGNAASQDQVTNVTQLSDVRPTDWAYEALRSLVERYGCIAGYPDGTFRGNRALSRYEFAAGLNACLQQVERLIASSTSNFVTKSDLETLQRLVDEFRTELTALGGRVDKLEGRVAFLEDHQFSTTTKLSGEAIFALTDELKQKITNNPVFQDRVRLALNTSFTGKDRLFTRLAAGNAQRFSDEGGSPLPEGIQTFNIGNTGNNNVVLDKLAYYFNFGASKVYLAATGGIHSDYAPTLNPYFEDYDGGNGALTTFASRNPIYRIGGGAGGAISFGVGPLESILGPSTLTVGYLAGANGTTFDLGANNVNLGPNNPNEKAGLFDGDYSALAQLNVNLGDRIGLGATYVHGYHNKNTAIFDDGTSAGGGTFVPNTVTLTNPASDALGRGVVGSFVANNPSASLFLIGGARKLTPVVTNSYGLEAAFRLTNNISISGFGSYTQAILLGLGRADIWTYGAGIAFSDFGAPGSVLGLFAGVEPSLRGVTPGLRVSRPGLNTLENAWHYEAFYKYKLNDHISITPGVIWLPVTNQTSSSSSGLIGTLRTTFTF
jgi:hypothetical protein